MGSAGTIGDCCDKCCSFFHLSGGTLCLQKRIFEVIERIKKWITALCWERRLHKDEGHRVRISQNQWSRLQMKNGQAKLFTKYSCSFWLQNQKPNKIKIFGQFLNWRCCKVDLLDIVLFDKFSNYVYQTRWNFVCFFQTILLTSWGL